MRKKKKKVVRKEEKEILEEELIFIAKINGLHLVSIHDDGDSSDLMQVLPDLGLSRRKPKKIITPFERRKLLMNNEELIDDLYLKAADEDGKINYYKLRKLWEQTFRSGK